MIPKTHALVILLLLIFTLSALTGCLNPGHENDDDADKNTEVINNNEISIHILHAGGAYDGLTLLNAQETFDDYYAMGYRYFEYDLKLSSDGRLIGTHSFEHLEIKDANISYEEFKQLKLSCGFTPVNEEWLMETIKNHPDVKIVVDAKMNFTDGDTLVLKRLEELEKIYNLDISANIIPEIFSIEMWKAVEQCTTFDRYLFSHYKEYYSVDSILENFSSPKIIGVAVPTWTDNYIKSNLYKVHEAGKLLFVFTVTNESELDFAKEIGADGIYINEAALKAPHVSFTCLSTFIEHDF